MLAGALPKGNSAHARVAEEDILSERKPCEVAPHTTAAGKTLQKGGFADRPCRGSCNEYTLPLLF